MHVQCIEGIVACPMAPVDVESISDIHYQHDVIKVASNNLKTLRWNKPSDLVQHKPTSKYTLLLQHISEMDHNLYMYTCPTHIFFLKHVHIFFLKHPPATHRQNLKLDINNKGANPFLKSYAPVSESKHVNEQLHNRTVEEGVEVRKGFAQNEVFRT